MSFYKILPLKLITVYKIKNSYNIRFIFFIIVLNVNQKENAFPYTLQQMLSVTVNFLVEFYCNFKNTYQNYAITKLDDNFEINNNVQNNEVETYNYNYVNMSAYGCFLHDSLRIRGINTITVTVPIIIIGDYWRSLRKQ